MRGPDRTRACEVYIMAYYNFRIPPPVKCVSPTTATLRCSRIDRSRRARAPANRRDDGREMGQSRRAWGIRARSHIFTTYTCICTVYTQTNERRGARQLYRRSLRFKVVHGVPLRDRRRRGDGREVVSVRRMLPW